MHINLSYIDLLNLSLTTKIVLNNRIKTFVTLTVLRKVFFPYMAQKYVNANMSDRNECL